MTRWDFLRHVPGGKEVQDAARRANQATKAMSSNREPPMVQILYSDVVAILWARGGGAILRQQRTLVRPWDGRQSLVNQVATPRAVTEGDVPTALDIVLGVPSSTSFRWKRLLRLPHEEKDEGLARRLARALANRKE